MTTLVGYPAVGFTSCQMTASDRKTLTGPGDEWVAADFNQIAPGYSRLHRSSLYNRYVLEIAASRASRERAVEVGCGYGDLTIELSRFYREVAGLDVSEEMLARARSACSAPNVRFHHRDGMDVRAVFERGSVDIVVVKFALHDIEDPARYIRSWVEVVRPGGEVIILDRFWCRSGYGRLRAAFDLETWMWRMFRSDGVRRADRVRLMLEDLVEWNSKVWREHRRHERRWRWEEWTAVLDGLGLRHEASRVNQRSFVARVWVP